MAAVPSDVRVPCFVTKSTSPSPSGDESVEAWALRYLLWIFIEEKLDHAHPPFLRGEHVSVTTVGSAALPTRPGRPPELKETKRSKKRTPKGPSSIRFVGRI